MRKPVFAICEQQRRTFVVRCLGSIIPLVSISEISSLYLVSVTAQTGLSLPWSQTPKTGFLVTRLNYIGGNFEWLVYEWVPIFRAQVNEWGGF